MALYTQLEADMEIIIKMSRRIPEKEEFQKFVDYLMAKYPFTKHGKFSVNIEKTRNKYTKGNCGNIGGYECKDGRRMSFITVRLSKNCSLNKALIVIAHEYCHSLQLDRSEKNYAMMGLSRKEKTVGGNDHELEADLFSLRVTSEYMNVHPHELLKESWDSLYRISKPACAQEFSYFTHEYTVFGTAYTLDVGKFYLNHTG